MPQGEMTFDAPGPGTWRLDTQHYPTPMTRFLQGFQTDTVGKTRTLAMARYGSFGTAKMIPVNGFMYARASPIATEPGSTEAPSIDHPEIQKRIARAFEVHRTKYWRSERLRWEEEVKPDSIRINLALASVDVDALDHDEALEHISRCRENLIEMSTRHHTFSPASTIPAGLLMAGLGDWTDLPFEDGLSLLDGATPLSAGVTPELVALADAVRADEAALAVLASDAAPEEVVEKLSAMPGNSGNAMRRFLLMDGHRLATGFDITAKMALELPEIMVANIAIAVDPGTPDRSAEAAVLARFVRNLVPQEHRESFDDLLADARACIGLKDDRGLYNDVWALGVARKALLGAGRRLVDEGRLSDQEHFLEADWEEMQAIWAGDPEPSAQALADRRKTRMSLSWRDAPPYLGSPPSPPPRIEGLPPEIGRWAASEQALVRGMGLIVAPTPDTDDLTGMTASKGTHEGVARVAVGDYDFSKIKSGDVLVTSIHSEAYNAVARMVGAIVTDTGGPLSHLAIVARELGIPCIVACKNATVVIPDGALVQIDADAGTVSVLE